ncbi:hypothetical protein DFH09DRAFT_1122564 [Mycena vulgaris]|nr:hypothetical protein DFH09DRAFT_1122564 [Mycena vulgaris]
MLSAHTTLIIAVVAGSVGGLLLVFVLYRVLRRPAKAPVPLPPKQELARYREQHAHVPESRPPTWHESRFLSAAPSAASKSSLVAPWTVAEAAPFRLPMAPWPLPLQLPHLPFDTSSTSLSTTETDSPPSSSPHLPSASVSSFSHTPPRHPRSPSTSSRPHRRSRPLSVGSTSSRNSRGVPHSPHSQIQIVLPAPLAFSDRISIHENSPRSSVVDQWAPMAVRSEGNPMPKPQRRSFSNSRPRPRRPPPTIIATIPTCRPASRPPPVPQIPQQWLPPSGDPLMGIPEDSGRGRLRDVAPSARKLLQKQRSRSRTATA